MKKVLMFGCSYSAGSYVYDKNDSELKMGEHLIPYSPGWFSFVDHFNDCKVTVISTWGEGYWFWYQYINIIMNEDLSEYDEIWIQETTEPRSSFCYPEEFELEALKKRWDINQVDNFEIHQMGGGTGPGGMGAKIRLTLDVGDGMRKLVLNRQLIQPHLAEMFINDENNLTVDVVANQALQDNVGKLHPNKFFDIITKACATEIDNICKRNNIPGYVWSMAEPIMECKYLKRIKDVEWVWRKFDQSMFSLREEVTKQIIKNMNYYQNEDIYTDPSTIILPLLNVQGNDEGLVDKYMSHQNIEGNKFIGKLINEQMET